MIIVERTDKPGLPIRIRLNDGNHDFTEAAAAELVSKLAAMGVASRPPVPSVVGEPVGWVWTFMGDTHFSVARPRWADDTFPAGVDAGAVEVRPVYTSRPLVPATTDPRDVVLPWAELMDLIAYFNTFGDDKAEAMLRGLKPVPSVVGVPSVGELHEIYRDAAYAKHKELGRVGLFVASSPEHITGIEAIHSHLLARQPSSQPDLSKVVKALEFYAKRDNWFASEHGPSQVMIHLSSIARDALYDLRNRGVR